MINESQTAVISRNDAWTGSSATEPYEAGWAKEAVIFVRALKDAKGSPGEARVEISPDGMRWIAEGSTMRLPVKTDEIAVARVKHFGNWLRVAADLPEGAALTILVTLHLKA
ncbi:hypothetical protein [Terrarubrum flagellatum]|uniref:hypothetical protein n=1 Tax=Terrirubrum flagellatum TaxID=2895980 RepID=UPI0031451167